MNTAQKLNETPFCESQVLLIGFDSPTKQLVTFFEGKLGEDVNLLQPLVVQHVVLN